LFSISESPTDLSLEGEARSNFIEEVDIFHYIHLIDNVDPLKDAERLPLGQKRPS
jgi:hypothetical protein